MGTLFYKIPPHLPFPKGGKIPLWQRGDLPARSRFGEGRGEILRCMSIHFESLYKIATI